MGFVDENISRKSSLPIGRLQKQTHQTKPLTLDNPLATDHLNTRQSSSSTRETIFEDMSKRKTVLQESETETEIYPSQGSEQNKLNSASISSNASTLVASYPNSQPISSKSSGIPRPANKKRSRAGDAQQEPPTPNPKPRKQLRLASEGPSTTVAHLSPSKGIMKPPSFKPPLKRNRNESVDNVPVVHFRNDSPNPRARKVQKLTPSPTSTPKRKGKEPTSVFMTLGGRRLSTPLRMSPPTIDLTASPPPGSPSDDPLLLTGPETPRRKRRAHHMRRGDSQHEGHRASSVKTEDGEPMVDVFTESSLHGDSEKSESPPSPSMPIEPSHSPSPSPVHSNPSPPMSYADLGGDAPSDSDVPDNSRESNDSQSFDENMGVFEEYTVPIRRGSPSPETVLRRSTTSLGQRKPTPRRLVLPGEGDLSVMAKTVYYEHDDDVDGPEPPSPSPGSRRRALAAAREAKDQEGSPTPYPRILDGLASDKEDENPEEHDDEQVDDDPSLEALGSDVSGYTHDQEGFRVMEEVSRSTDNNLGAEHDSQDIKDESGEQIIPPSTSILQTLSPKPGGSAVSHLRASSARSASPRQSSRPSAPISSFSPPEPSFGSHTYDEDQWGASLDDIQPHVEPTLTFQFDPSEEVLVAGDPSNPSVLEDQRSYVNAPDLSRVMEEDEEDLHSSSTRGDSHPPGSEEHDEPMDQSIEDEEAAAAVVLEEEPDSDVNNGLDDQAFEDVGHEHARPEGREATQHQAARLQSVKEESPHPVARHTSIPRSSPPRALLAHPDRAISSYENDVHDLTGALSPSASESGSEDDETPVVEVSSMNPRAAARAVAILRLHHAYIVEDGDVTIASQSSRSRSRRRHSRGNASLSRSRSRARSDNGNVSTVSLPELLQEAENEVLNNSITNSPSKAASSSFLQVPSWSSGRRGRTSPIPSHIQQQQPVPTTSRLQAESSDQTRNLVSQKWAKNDWKNLERCFIRERKSSAQRVGLTSSKDVNPTDVDLEAVVQRFLQHMEDTGDKRRGPDWESENVLLRTLALQKRLIRVAFQTQRQATPSIDYAPHAPETPSTFGDDFEYELGSSRQSSMRRSRSLSVQSLPPSLLAPQYAHLHEEAKNIASSSRNSSRENPSRGSRVSGTDTNPSSGGLATRGTESVANRFLGYIGLSHTSATPPASDRESRASGSGTLRRPLQREGSRALSDGGTFKVPEMSEYRRDVQLTLPEPLRRASNAPMKDPSVRISREYEDSPSLRHQDLPGPRPTPPPTSIFIPPLQPVPRAASKPVSIPNSSLRKVSSNSSVKDLVRSFEDLSEEMERETRQSTPRSQSQGVDGGSLRRSGRSNSFSGSSGDGRSTHTHQLPQSQFPDDTMDEGPDDTFERGSAPGQSAASTTSPNIEPKLESTTLTNLLPPRKAIPPTAPPKKRMSFLGSWRH